MAKEKEETKSKLVHSGRPLTEEELKEQEQVWKDIEDSIKKVYKESK